MCFLQISTFCDFLALDTFDGCFFADVGCFFLLHLSWFNVFSVDDSDPNQPQMDILGGWTCGTLPAGDQDSLRLVLANPSRHFPMFFQFESLSFVLGRYFSSTRTCPSRVSMAKELLLKTTEEFWLLPKNKIRYCIYLVEEFLNLKLKTIQTNLLLADLKLPNKLLKLPKLHKPKLKLHQSLTLRRHDLWRGGWTPLSAAPHPTKQTMGMPNTCKKHREKYHFFEAIGCFLFCKGVI